MKKLTGVVKSRSIERGQWSELGRNRTDLLVNGLGEGLVEEVYFGTGYANPPTFSYSSVFQQEEVDVWPWFMTSPRGSLDRVKDAYGLGNDSQSHNGMIFDPSFESQGKYMRINTSVASIIPTVDQRADRVWDYRDGKITEAEAAAPIPREVIPGLVNGYANRYDPSPDIRDYPTWHGWYQTSDTRNHWSLTTSEHHDIGVGEAGDVSARATIGPNGYTNWLIPLDPDSVYMLNRDYDAAVPGFIKGPESWRVVRSVPERGEARYESQTRLYPPPFLSGFEGFAYVRSTSGVELQVKAVYSAQGCSDKVERGTKVFPDTKFQDYNVTGSTYSYRELATVEYKGSVGTGGWKRIDIDLPYDGWRAWPDSEYCLNEKNEPFDAYWTFLARIKGTPGQIVYLDNFYLTRQMRNAVVPVLTVGVKEWIRDEAGVYIGAQLWVTLGEPVGQVCEAP